MCTVTFVPRRKGYWLAMNRDEKRLRVKEVPPALREIHGLRVIYPSEPTGGTWVASNERGISFSLINWYSVSARVARKAVSRGVVIPSVAAADSATTVDGYLSELPLNSVNPFRLIAVFPNSAEIKEWKWDLTRLGRTHHPWRAQQWISSGFDELMAQHVRGKTFCRAETQKSAGTLEWLRRLHRSHSPETGPFSTCMHRNEAATVCYTEVSVSAKLTKMRHICGPPCGWPGDPTPALKFFRRG